jgi:membrane-anchored protein YejM (alkaline phosphatase superfamily)
MPRTEIMESDWTPAERAEFTRRRRGRNYLLLAALGAFSLLIYAIALVKLHEYGQMW